MTERIRTFHARSKGTYGSPRVHQDLFERRFTATAPDRLWVADITCIPTWAGFLYLAVVLYSAIIFHHGDYRLVHHLLARYKGGRSGDAIRDSYRPNISGAGKVKITFVGKE